MIPAPPTFRPLPKNGSPDRGWLTFVQDLGPDPGDGRLTEFTLNRAFWVYGVPPGTLRGGHAHRLLHQLFIAVHGQLTIECSTASWREKWYLTDPSFGLRVPPGNWVDLHFLTRDAVLLCLCSDTYDEAEYIRDHAEYLDWLRGPAEGT